MAVLSDHASAVATLTLTAALPAAAYIGFMAPRRWSRLGVAAVAIAVVALQFALPELDPVNTAVTVALVLVGWFGGLIPRHGHRFGFRQAERLAATDRLTGALNRRGFLEQLAFDLRTATPEAPAAVLLIDLDDFKSVNDDLGHAAGDELLAWVGATLPPLLPASAVFGRLGGDEFAVLLPATGVIDAVALATRLREAIAARRRASIGVGTTDDGSAHHEEVLDAAVHAFTLARHDAEFPVQHRSAGQKRRDAEPPAPPAVTYAAIRRGAVSTTPAGQLVFDGRWALASTLVIAFAGTMIVIATFLADGASFYQQLVRIFGIPWLIANVTIGVIAARSEAATVEAPDRLYHLAALLLGIGVATAALASGDGAASPIIGALLLKVLFDASMFDRRSTVRLFAVIVGCWLLTLALGPPDVLWVAPFQGLLFYGAFRLGALGRAGFASATSGRLKLANTDDLTGLLNRRGFEATGQRMVDQARSGGISLAVITIDLDGLGDLNEAQGLDVGDRTLQSVAGVLIALPDAYGAGRIGGDEFSAAMPAASAEALAGQVEALREQLALVHPGSVGGALYGIDGDSLEGLMQVADRRAYRAKESARRKRLRALRGKPRRPG